MEHDADWRDENMEKLKIDTSHKCLSNGLLDKEW